MTSQALTGAVLQNINHGISTGALFLLVGWIYERRHTRAIDELRDYRRSPRSSPPGSRWSCSRRSASPG
jgi:NADH:ubiquinone oxidoreductase subunit 4 (subunit M)